MRFVLILLLVVGACLPQDSNSPAKPLSLSQVWTLDATYTDHEHGVTFRYPATWESTTQFAYHPPALTSPNSKPIAGFGYSEGGFPRSRIIGPYTKTNLEGVGIVYSAIPVTNAAKCELKAASLSDSPNHSRAVFGERTFSAYKTGAGGMSQYIEGKLYAIYLGRIAIFSKQMQQRPRLPHLMTSQH
jgi:hypothetical protein